MPTFQSLLGLAAFITIAWLFSEARARVPWRAVVAGLGLQFVLGALLLGLPAVQQVFLWLNDLVVALTDATQEGTAFVFGYVGGDEPPFPETGPGDTFILAFQALPLILVLSALSALLFYWRVLPWLVRGASRLLQRALGIGGALGVGTAGNLFLGMVESPLLIRPYLRAMSRSELFALMTVGMATLAGTMLVLYATIIGTVVDDALGHLMVASLISLPAALLVATVMIPPDGTGLTGDVEPTDPEPATGAMDAVVRGTLRGLELLLQIIALLVVIIALVALVNSTLGLLPAVAGEPLTLERMLGWVFAPLAWLMGIPWDEARAAGSLLGVKTVLNEMVAFLQMAEMGEAFSPRSELILVYALAGFANFGSLGIMIGGLGGLLPDRRPEIVALGMRSIVAGTLATLMTGAVVGVLASVV